MNQGCQKFIGWGIIILFAILAFKLGSWQAAIAVIVVGFIVIIIIWVSIEKKIEDGRSLKEYNQLNKIQSYEQDLKNAIKENASKTETIELSNTYTLSLRTNDKNIKLHNPFRGIFVGGGAGSGKSESIIIPLLEQFIQFDFCGLLYDFKYPTLTNDLKLFKKHYGKDIPIVEFSFNSFKTRINPIAPRYISTISHVQSVAKTIFQNLNRESIQKPDYWVTSATNMLSSVIWWFLNHHPERCNLPNVIAFCLQDIALIIDKLRQDIACRGLIQGTITAFDKKAEGQLSGVFGALQNTLATLNTPELFYLLSGDDVHLDLNNPDLPAILVLGNNPTLSEVYSPVLAVIIKISLSLMNDQDKHHSFVVLDEAPTIYIPDFEKIPATARSNKIATVFSAQDFAQIEENYGRQKLNTLMANLAIQFFGRVSNRDTVEHITRMFGKYDRIMESQSDKIQSNLGQNTASRSHSYRETDVLKVQDILNLRSGEMVGVLVESNYTFIQDQFKMVDRINMQPVEEPRHIEPTSEELYILFERLHNEVLKLMIN